MWDTPILKYCFVQAYNSAMDDYINKSIFKDKKLNYLWTKAEASGFTMEELLALREEFTHHQEKIDQYYDLLSDDSPKDDAFKSKFFYNNYSNFFNSMKQGRY